MTMEAQPTEPDNEADSNKNETVRLVLGSEPGINPVDKIIGTLWRISSDPEVKKVELRLIYSPVGIFEALSLYDAIALCPQSTKALVSGRVTPELTLALQGANLRIATVNSWFQFHPLVAVGRTRATASETEVISTSLAELEKIGRKIVAARSGVDESTLTELYSNTKLHSAAEVEKLGPLGLIDLIIRPQ